MPILRGGHATYGQPVGIIMLDCAFPRPPGDIGNARSFPFPVRYEVLKGIPAARLTREEEPNAVAALIRAAERLELSGARVILTSCGLFLRYQERLAAAVKVPVATSAVLLLPFLATLLPLGRKVGILTADASTLAPVLARDGRFDAARFVLAGLEDRPVFRRAILDAGPPFTMDTEALQAEFLDAAGHLLALKPALGAFLIECTNLSPYSGALRARFGLPVFDAIDLACLLQRASAVD
jgi:hypothetical protein